MDELVEPKFNIFRVQPRIDGTEVSWFEYIHPDAGRGYNQTRQQLMNLEKTILAWIYETWENDENFGLLSDGYQGKLVVAVGTREQAALFKLRFG